MKSQHRKRSGLASKLMQVVFVMSFAVFGVWLLLQAHAATPSDTVPPSIPTNLHTTGVTSSRVSLTWNASTDNVGVTGYHIWRDNFQIGISLGAFNDSQVQPGQTYTYTVDAYDADGNVSAQSAPLSVTIPPTNTPDTTNPTTTITAPTNNASLSGATTISASATDNVGVVKVELYIDNVLSATDLNAPYSFNWDTTAFTNGSHNLTVKAYDAADNTATSSIVTVTVNNVTPPGPKPGDVNGDGKVDVFDASILLFNYNKSPASRAQGDLNGDNTVNVFDASILLFNWGK